MTSTTTTPPTTDPNPLAGARLAGIKIATIAAPSDLAAVHRSLLDRGSAAEGKEQDRYIDAASSVATTHSSWTRRTRDSRALHVVHQVLYALADHLAAGSAESTQALRRAYGWIDQMQMLERDPSHHHPASSIRPRRRWFR
ncbi:hypothetical protein FRP1_29735 (plasmid) [Pseudonocardia sp. EC080625-04]|uniref:hypothetical protein n=1 Tax=Pseudonocardia sp. EC080625-04 TaxID=1096868 RepID=UPI0006CB4FE3|nr:hypothetical protein [Pseudonocardia sp. EC080625-04]ALE76930.1 hypothetical protein FRP1_29735 [Pseudonocardia sp. EC080625-04]